SHSTVTVAGGGRSRASAIIRDIGPLAALLVLAAGFSLADRHFASVANIQAILEAAALPMVLATGATFVIVMGSIDLSVEGIMGIACVITAVLVRNTENAHDLGIVGIGAALASGLVLGLLNGALNVYLRLPSLMATIGTWFLGLGCAYILFPDHQPNILYPGLVDLVSHRLFGLNYLVYLALAILVLAHLIFRFTPLGRTLYAIGGDEAVAAASGIPIRRA